MNEFFIGPFSTEINEKRDWHYSYGAVINEIPRDILTNPNTVIRTMRFYLHDLFHDDDFISYKELEEKCNNLLMCKGRQDDNFEKIHYTGVPKPILHTATRAASTVPCACKECSFITPQNQDDYFMKQKVYGMNVMETICMQNSASSARSIKGMALYDEVVLKYEESEKCSLKYPSQQFLDEEILCEWIIHNATWIDKGGDK